MCCLGLRLAQETIPLWQRSKNAATSSAESSFGQGERFSRSLRTTNEREALSRLARLDDNLRRFELASSLRQMTPT
jgi:hypothetical protein